MSVINSDAVGSEYFSVICIETPYIRCANKGVCESLRAAFITTHKNCRF